MEIGNKDVYEYILNLADDKTTINMIRANPKVFDNENFYEKVMRKRYPLLIEFRKENETWKALYLRMVYTLAKLEEDYKIPYIPTKGCNPERLLLWTEKYKKETLFTEALKCSAAGGHIQLIDYFLEKGADIESGLNAAGRYSNIDVVKYLISKGATHYGFLLHGAILGEKLEIMKFAIDTLKLKGWDINHISRQTIYKAIDNDNIKAIDLLVKNGLIIRREDLEYALDRKKYHIADYLNQFM